MAHALRRCPGPGLRRCVRIATLNDLTADWTGGMFSADGKHFYVSVQHNISGFGVILDITGWK
jgi:secreted PhoX family phosphatase